MAVSVTVVPVAKAAQHVLPHEMPDGFEVTVPSAVEPTLETDKVTTGTNVAVTVRASLIVTEHVLEVAIHPPYDQPAIALPALGVAVNSTVAPDSNDAVHEDPHEIPGGLEDTDPEPEPVLDTVRA